ncbi:hypothetical protein A2U01_0095038, partial [Trifolium medium]|nr:hypothetical protein [Trifolium medium]
ARLAILEQPPQEEDTSSPYISEEEPIEIAEQDPPPPPPPRRTLGDYGLRNHGEIANLGFQLANPVMFDIKNTVISTLK